MKFHNLALLNLRLRPVVPADLYRIAELYNFSVPTLATMDTIPPPPDSWLAWLNEHSAPSRYCAYACCDENDTVVAFVSLSAFARRGAYQASAEVSIYIDPQTQSVGIGEALCKFIVNQAEIRGFTMVIGMMTANNTRSRRILKAVGFNGVGTIHGIAVKNETLIDMEVWEYLIPANWGKLGRLDKA